MVFEIFAITVLLPGLALLLAGLRGRRIDDHPMCRKCRFDLTGRPDDSTRCPECGVDLRRRRAVFVGNRRRRTGLVRGGFVLIVIAAAAVGIDGWTRLHHVHWLRYATTTYLVRQASAADSGRRSAALTELLDRLATGRMNATERDVTADAGLAYQADLSKPWAGSWGILLERARATGGLSDDRWRRYAAQAVGGVYRSARLRPRVTSGDPLPSAIAVQSGRVAFNSVLSASVHGLRLKLDDQRVTSTEFLYPKRLDDPYTTSLGYTWRAGELPRNLSPGVHLVHMMGNIWVGTPRGFEDVTPVAVVPLDLPTSTTVTRASEPSVVLVPAPNLADAIRRSLKFTPPVHKGANNFGSAMVWVNGNPVALSFAVTVRTAEGYTYPAGTLAIPAHTSNTAIGIAAWSTSLIGQPVDVILHADPTAAVGSIDITTAWDGELEFKGVR